MRCLSSCCKRSLENAPSLSRAATDAVRGVIPEWRIAKDCRDAQQPHVRMVGRQQDGKGVLVIVHMRF